MVKFWTQHADRVTGPTVRPLTVEDSDALLTMIHDRPVANLFPLEHYERIGLPRPSFLTKMHSASPFLGVFEPTGQDQIPTLRGCVWFGVNIVPLHLETKHFSRVANYILRSRKNTASLFGPAEYVMPLWEWLRGGFPTPFDVRPNQPLMVLGPNSRRESVEESAVELPEVRWGLESDLEALLPASVAMFTEEVGYSPLGRDPEGYTQRVRDTVRAGRSVLARDETGRVVFKADLGLAADGMCQLQGVWLAPDLRGQGFSEPFLIRACELIRPRFPTISLYVNDYNAPARALYKAVGFEEVGSFATILL
ncbi:GNAT family N-acetyltransferase [Kocuria massiliensis]|uniref:GNAT family N-acetyltransferase n=1 Tax=Kocuria massiliensis TaxID=1926282 RepID=UPI000A1C7D43|nr:GNAT family N-acetyltransferase [Kocuria massiliensis]